MGHRVALTALATAIVVALIGCGGGGSSTYNRSAFTACLQQHGANMRGTIEGMPALKARFVRLLGTANILGAEFSENGLFPYLFVFASDPAGARKAVDRFKRFKRFANLSFAQIGSVTATGNLVLLAQEPATEGVQKIISACEESAKRP